MFKKTIVALVMGGLAVAVAALGPAQALEIRWGTSRAGSSGHRAVTNLSQVLKREMPELDITVQPTPGAILTVKGYALGDFEGYYGSDIAFYELANDISRFKGFKAKMKRQPVQSFWTFTIEMGVGIHARDRDKITQWRDLDKQRVFTGPRPWDTRAQLERAFKVLGIEHEYMEVSVKTAGSLLEQGQFAAFGVYSNAEAGTSPWITEASIQADWAALSPSAEEIGLLEKAGFKVVNVSTKVFGKKKTYSDKVAMLPFYYGLHLGLETSADIVYKLLKTVEKNAQELAKVDKAFKQIATDMPDMQRRGVTSAVDFVPIHPGLARYMREKGVWDAKWDSRVAKAK